MQAYQYELKPNGAQRRDMRRFAGACRFVFNKALAWQKERYASDNTTRFSYTVLANFLPAWKLDKETEWLKNSPSQSLQQALSRKIKFSNNWKKAKANVQRLHSLISNCRKDYLHQATTTISQNHAIVCIEDLQVRSMSSSAAGTAETPGRNVRAKSGLNKAILDQGWFEFRRQLDYKLAWTGGWLVAVPRTTPARPALSVGIAVKQIARRKRLSSVCNAVLRNTPIWSVRSMS